MKRKENNWFHQFLLYFMLTLCVPLLSIIFVYSQAEGTVRREILVSTQSNLNQFFSMTNSITEEMGDICISIAHSNECVNYSAYANYDSKKAHYQIVNVKDMLNKFLRDSYQDVFVYFPTQDRIISGMNASLNTDLYYDTYYSGIDDGVQEEFYKMLECDSSKPKFFSLNQSSEKSYLCVAMKRPDYQNPELSYVVVVMLEPGFLNRMIDQEKNNSTKIMMFDENSKILWSSDRKYSDWELKGTETIDEFYEMKMNGDTYMMLIKESGDVVGYYASAIPLSYFWNRLNRMRLICGGSILLCIAVSIFVAYRNAARTYRTVNHVVGGLQKKLVNTKSLRRDKVMIELIRGNNESLEKLEERISDVGIEFCSDWFMVAVANTKTEDAHELISFVLRNVFEELCNEAHKGYVVIGTNQECIILLNPHNDTEYEEMERILREGERFLNTHYQMEMTLALSNLHEGIEEIPLAYKEAGKALRYQYLMEDRTVIKYGEVAQRRLQSPKSGDSYWFKQVRKYIEEGEKWQTPEQFAEELVESYGISESASMETVESFKLEIVNVLSRIMISEEDSSEESRKVTVELLTQSNFRLFKKTLVKYLEQFCQKEKERNRQNDVCCSAKNHIEKNFADPELSATVIGETLNLSGPYLSRMFKEKYGVSILHYIANTRIDHAKKLLLESEKSIQEIAEESGFLSSNVFIKSFKKQEGVTPGTYRSWEEEKLK